MGFAITNTGMPRISAADFADVKPPYVHFRRKYHEYILYYILSGELFLAENGEEYHLQENDLIILEPSMEHWGTKTSGCRFLYVHFDWEGIKRDASGADGQAIIVPKYYAAETVQGILRLRDIAERLTEDFCGTDLYGRQKAACHLQELLLTAASEYAGGLRRRSLPVRGKARQIIPELIAYLNQNYAEDISGERIQERFHYHFDYLNRQFKRWTGSTIFVYLNMLRVKRAGQLLATGFYTTEEVARQTGFRDMYYFSRVFKRYTGMTPGQAKRGGRPPLHD